jgi:hypothetical protein
MSLGYTGYSSDLHGEIDLDLLYAQLPEQLAAHVVAACAH